MRPGCRREDANHEMLQGRVTNERDSQTLITFGTYEKSARGLKIPFNGKVNEVGKLSVM